MLERKKVGLALGSGGARGFAHIGVLKVLEENNIPIDFIAGSSAGAIVGALYASEPNAKKLEKDALEATWRDFFDFTISKSGLVKGNKISKFLDDKLAGVSFKDLKIPLYVVALDIENNQEIIFHKGDVAKAVRASISIPGIFQPVENDGRLLVDGGVIDPLPVGILRREGAEIIIAVDIEDAHERPVMIKSTALRGQSKRTKDIFYVITRTTQILSSQTCKYEMEKNKPEILLIPPLEKIGIFDFKQTKKVISIGERETRKNIERIKKLLEPNIAKELMQELKKDINVKQIVSDIRKS